MDIAENVEDSDIDMANVEEVDKPDTGKPRYRCKSDINTADEAKEAKQQ